MQLNGDSNMTNYISIDSGTTNTRITLVKDRNIIKTIKLPIGAKQKELLETKIKEAIKQLLANYNMTERDIKRILASGMITSEFGICPLEHLPTPAGISKLNKNMKEVYLSHISEIPFVFMRGVKITDSSLEGTGVMRGEET